MAYRILRGHGPLVSTFSCLSDVYKIGIDYLYIPKDRKNKLKMDGRSLTDVAHAAMMIGTETATYHGEMISYWIGQNNWPPPYTCICRFPISIIVDKYEVRFKGEVSLDALLEELKLSGLNRFVLITYLWENP